MRRTRSSTYGIVIFPGGTLKTAGDNIIEFSGVGGMGAGIGAVVPIDGPYQPARLDDLDRLR